ncbi:MAG: UbiA family prenyltransferase [Eubacteriales bacterium]|nr:UbiA family prenyltransferase [Eubacteriales bacterium]
MGVLSRYFSFVEITTKITSVFAFIYAVSYMFYVNRLPDSRKTLVFFASMFIFDLTATAINNYVDTKSNGNTLQFGRKTAAAIIIIQLFICLSLGIYLVFITDIVVLFLGALCFLIGIIYSFGPLSISRLPFGEAFSGLFYGFFIPFIILYINFPDGTFLSYHLDAGTLTFSVHIVPVITVIMLSVVPFCVTAGIMLANNICDLERDAAVNRFTLPYYTGSKSLYLFAGLYYTAYTAIIIMAILGILPPVCLLAVATLIPVQRNINKFFDKQDKSTTFILSVKNYIIIMFTVCLLTFTGSLI